MEDEILLIDKPAGWTSFDVVAKIRGHARREMQRSLQEREGKGAAGAADSFRAPRDEGKPSVVPHKRKRLKVGHAGTLDPFATGLLIILIGNATKKAGEFLKLDKVYEAEIILGKTSTTGDPEGDLTTTDLPPETSWRQTEVEEVLGRFVGEIRQRPPIFSAIKINGQRAYKLARDGKEVEIPERTVTIHSLELLEYSYPSLKIRTHVGSGTYIRSLAVDIGEALGTGAYCKELRRTKIADWSVSEARSVAEVTDI